MARVPSPDTVNKAPAPPPSPLPPPAPPNFVDHAPSSHITPLPPPKSPHPPPTKQLRRIPLHQSHPALTPTKPEFFDTYHLLHTLPQTHGVPGAFLCAESLPASAPSEGDICTDRTPNPQLTRKSLHRFTSRIQPRILRQRLFEVLQRVWRGRKEFHFERRFYSFRQSGGGGFHDDEQSGMEGGARGGKGHGLTSTFLGPCVLWSGSGGSGGGCGGGLGRSCPCVR